MPLKKVDKYSSKMSYAVDWSSPKLAFYEANPKFPQSVDYWKLSYRAVGVRKSKDELELTIGDLWGVDIDTDIDTSEHSNDYLQGIFTKKYDTRYGIRWVAKLSGEDDIKLSSSNSFKDYTYYYRLLHTSRNILLSQGYLHNFEGWYQNA